MGVQIIPVGLSFIENVFEDLVLQPKTVVLKLFSSLLSRKSIDILL